MDIRTTRVSPCSDYDIAIHVSSTNPFCVIVACRQMVLFRFPSHARGVSNGSYGALSVGYSLSFSRNSQADCKSLFAACCSTVDNASTPITGGSLMAV